MPWEGSDRKARLPANWDTDLRPAVLKRCGYRCEWRLPSGARCPRAATDVDHKRAGDDHSLANLQGLCPEHHKAKTAQEANAQRWSRKRRRPPEAHPGALR